MLCIDLAKIHLVARGVNICDIDSILKIGLHTIQLEFGGLDLVGNPVAHQRKLLAPVL